MRLSDSLQHLVLTSDLAETEYSYQSPGKVTTTYFIDVFITNSFRLLSVPNEIADIPTKKRTVMVRAQQRSRR
jgi:hypothetical protein